MTRAYVLVNTEPGQTGAVQQALRARPGIHAADLVIGPYDLILQLEAADIHAIGKLVMTEIRGVAGVLNTLTCPVVEPPADTGGTRSD